MLHMLNLLLIFNLLITIYTALNAKAYLEPCTNVYDGVFSAKIVHGFQPITTLVKKLGHRCLKKCWIRFWNVLKVNN